jgi:ketosteroid isomerase-like protein
MRKGCIVRVGGAEVTIEANKQIVRRAFEGLQAGDLGAVSDLLAPDAVVHQCGFLEPLPARAMLSGAFPGGGRIDARDLHIERMIGEGDLVALHWRVTGRYAAPDEPEINGRPVSVPWMTFVRVDGGRIAELWNIRDTSTLETQLREPADTAGVG